MTLASNAPARALVGAVGLLLASATACGGEAVPAKEAAQADAIDWVPMDTGRGCARADAACGRGSCVARVENGCAEPVQCELTVQCVCQAFTGESGEALAHARDTAPARGKVGLRAHAICSDGEILATQAKKVVCR